MFENKKNKEVIELVIAPPSVKHSKLRLNDIDTDPTKLMKLSSGVKQRRSAGIAGYVGFNGSAKTATMVRDTLPDLEMGRKVLSTVAFYDWKVKADSAEQALDAWSEKGALDLRPKDELVLPHPLWIPLNDWTQVPEFRNGVLCLDEITGVADARETSSLPIQIANMFFQMRRAQVQLRWTTIDWTAADKRMRRATQTVSMCRGFLPKTVPGKVWKQKSLFRIQTFDARGFEDFTTAMNRTSAKQRPKPLHTEWVKLHGGLAEAITAYGSEMPVLTVGAATEAGMCMDCGGKRAMPRCKC